MVGSRATGMFAFFSGDCPVRYTAGMDESATISKCAVFVAVLWALVVLMPSNLNRIETCGIPTLILLFAQGGLIGAALGGTFGVAGKSRRIRFVCVLVCTAIGGLALPVLIGLVFFLISSGKRPIRCSARASHDPRTLLARC